MMGGKGNREEWERKGVREVVFDHPPRLVSLPPPSSPPPAAASLGLALPLACSLLGPDAATADPVYTESLPTI